MPPSPTAIVVSPCGPTPVGAAARKLRPSSLERRTKTVRPIVDEESQIVPSPPRARFGCTEVPPGSTGAAGPKSRPPVGRKGGSAAPALPPATRREAARKAAARRDPIAAQSYRGAEPPLPPT